MYLSRIDTITVSRTESAGRERTRKKKRAMLSSIAGGFFSIFGARIARSLEADRRIVWLAMVDRFDKTQSLQPISGPCFPSVLPVPRLYPEISIHRRASQKTTTPNANILLSTTDEYS